MTLRGCLFGNSHIAALKQAWEGAPGRWPGLALDFVGGPRDTLARTAVEGGVLRAGDEDARAALERLNGRAEFPLAGYDVLGVAGAAMSVFPALRLYRRCRFPGLPSLAGLSEPEEAAADLVSEPAFRAALADALRRTAGLRLGAQLAASGAPVVLIAQPRPALRCIRAGGPYGIFARALEAGDAPALSAAHESAFRAAAEGAGRVLPQPPGTIRRGLFTRRRFTAGSVGLERGHGGRDMLHANAAYGRLVLDALYEAVLGRPVPEGEASGPAP